VQRLEREHLQDQQVERALRQVETVSPLTARAGLGERHSNTSGFYTYDV
jgi:hypothetical protein